MYSYISSWLATYMLNISKGVPESPKPPPYAPDYKTNLMLSSLIVILYPCNKKILYERALKVHKLLLFSQTFLCSQTDYIATCPSFVSILYHLYIFSFFKKKPADVFSSASTSVNTSYNKLCNQFSWSCGQKFYSVD